MQTILDSADRPAHDAFVEKKSEFIGDACHISSLDEALAFVRRSVTSIRKPGMSPMPRCVVDPMDVLRNA